MSELEKEVESAMSKKRSPRGKSTPETGESRSAKRRAAPAKPAAAKKKAPARRATAKKPAGRARTAATPGSISADERIRLISEAAYFRAESRGFRGGDPERDWIEAEAEVDALLLQEHPKDE